MSDVDKIVAAILTHGQLSSKHDLAALDWVSRYEQNLANLKNPPNDPHENMGKQLEDAMERTKYRTP